MEVTVNRCCGVIPISHTFGPEHHLIALECPKCGRKVKVGYFAPQESKSTWVPKERYRLNLDEWNKGVKKNVG